MEACLESIYNLLSCWFSIWLILNVSKFISNEINKLKVNLGVRRKNNG